MKKYIIIATLVLYNIIGAMDTTLDMVIHILDDSMYRTITHDVQKNTLTKEKIEQVMVANEDGKKILETYNKTRLTRKKFNMTHIAQNIQWQAKL